MKSLFKRITSDQSPGEGDVPGFSQAVAKSVHSLFQRFTGPAMPHRDGTVVDILRQASGPSPEDTVTTASQPQYESRPPRVSSEVNQESSSVSAELAPGPRNPGTNLIAVTVGKKVHDARKNKLDPLRRYFSPRSHSFPDYGHIRSDSEMAPGGQFLKHLNASFGRPIDTMSASTTQTVVPSVDRLHGPKRQKTDHPSGYTPFSLTPVGDHDSATQDRSLKSERRRSLSLASTEEKTWHPGVHEYRRVEGLHDPNRQHRGHRSRPNKRRLMQFMSSIGMKDPIQDDSDDSITESSVPCRPTLHGTGGQANGRVRNRSTRDPADLAILGLGGSDAVSPAKQEFAHTVHRGKKRLQHSDMNGEVDELAGDPDYQPHKRLNAGPKRQQTAQSLSVSTRGDLKPSLAGRKPAPLEEVPLPLKALVWAPNQIYDASKPSAEGQPPESLGLKSRETTDNTAILTLCRATFPDEDSPEYAWFQVQSQKITKVKIDYERFFGKVTLPSDVYSNLGATLYLRFYCEEDTRKFSGWIRRYTSLPSMDPQDSLEKEFLKQYAEICKRPAPKLAPVSRPPTDAEINRLHTRRGIVATGARSEKRVVDMLEPASAVGPGPSAYAMSDDELSELTRRPRRSVRTRRDPVSPAPPPIPDRWTEVHPDWDKDWRLPLSFHRTSVEKDDIARLDEGQCLNDNIIGFYLKYLQIQAETQRPETSKRIYFHNSFFYSKLKPTSGRQINYDGVKNWTAKVDIFSYDYIVVPVNEHFHWWVAIICNPGKLGSTVAEKGTGSPESGDEVEEVLAVSSNGNAAAIPSPQDGSDVVVQDFSRVTIKDDEDGPSNVGEPLGNPASADERNGNTTESGEGHSAVIAVDDDVPAASAKNAAQKSRKRGRKSLVPAQRKYDPADPRIITLDSLGASHSPVCTHLKQYLIAEFKDKKGKDVEYNQSSIGMRATNIPEQDNFCDCGVYLLKYVAEFLDDPDKFIQSILLREGRQWDFDASKMRNDIRQLIFDLHEPYQKEQEEAKRQKALAKRKRERSKSEGPGDGYVSSAPKSSAERAMSPQQVEDSTPNPSLRTSPVAERPASPRQLGAGSHEVMRPADAKAPPKAQQNRPGEISPYDKRSFLVVDIKAGKPAQADGSRPQSRRSPARPSKPLPSIEIPDDDEPLASRVPQPQPSSRHASLSVGAGSVEETDDKLVRIRPSGSTPAHIKTTQEHRRKRSWSQTELGAEGFYGGTITHDSVPRSAKPTSPLKKASAPNFVDNSGPMSEKSPHFGTMDRGRREHPRVRKTYKGSGKTSSGGTIDLTED